MTTAARENLRVGTWIKLSCRKYQQEKGQLLSTSLLIIQDMKFSMSQEADIKQKKLSLIHRVIIYFFIFYFLFFFVHSFNFICTQVITFSKLLLTKFLRSRKQRLNNTLYDTHNVKCAQSLYLSLVVFSNSS